MNRFYLWLFIFFSPQYGLSVQLSSGLYHSCALRDGQVHCWGQGEFGQLGSADFQNRSQPKRVLGLPQDIVEIASGAYHNCALDVAGSVYCWGYNRSGQLGHGKPIPDFGYPIAWPGEDGRPRYASHEPKKVPGLPSMASLAASRATTCGLDRKNQLHCWGDGKNYQMGDGTRGFSNASSTVRSSKKTLASLIALENGFCGLALNKQRLYCFGYTIPSGRASAWSVLKLPGGERFQSVAAGDQHLCAIDENQQLWCVGQGWYGQVGTDDNQDLEKWTKISEVKTTQVFSRKKTTCFSDTSGKTHCLGLCLHGLCGTTGHWPTAESGQKDYLFTTRKPIALSLTDLLGMSFGATHVCSTNHRQQVHCWGQGFHGQLGTPGLTSTFVPQEVQIPKFRENPQRQ